MFSSLQLTFGYWTAAVLALAIASSAAVLFLLLLPTWRRRFDRSRAARSRSLAFEIALCAVLMTAVPGLWAGLAVGEVASANGMRNVGARLAIRASAIAARLDRDLVLHRAGIETFAAGLDGVNALPSPEALEAFRARFPSFVTVLIADREGLVVARAGRGLSEPIEASPALNVRDRPYFAEPLRTKQSYVSGVFRGRGFSSDPIVAISAPLFTRDGEVGGVLEGSLDIAAWPRELYAGGNEPGSLLLLADPEQRAVYSNASWHATALDELAAHPRFAPAVGRLGAAVMTDQPDGSDRWITVVDRSKFGWFVAVALPLSEVRARLVQELWGGALAITLGAAAAIAIGLVLARRASHTIGRLVRAMTQYRADAPAVAPRVARSSPKEIRGLFLAFRRLQHRLRGAIADRNRTIVQRDEFIKERLTEIAVKNAALTDLNLELELLARSDSLTGIANRRAFDERLAALWDALARLRIPLAVVLFDVDRFKQYNDRYGHDAGDSCLRRIAAIVSGATERASDLVARIGGEEFGVLLPGTELAAARTVAEQLRQSIEAGAIPHEDSPNGVVTASFGVAAIVPRSDLDRVAVVRSADAALYAAKSGGRNRVEVAAAAIDGTSLLED